MADEKKSDKSSLTPFYQVVNPVGLLGGFELTNPTKTSDTNLVGINEFVLNLIINSDRYNAYTVDEIIKKINDFSATKNPTEADDDLLNNIIQIYSDLLPPKKSKYHTVEGKNVTLSNCIGLNNAELSSKMSVLFSNSPHISLNVRNVNQVVLFLQSLPTLEISKCVPYLDINFQFNRETLNAEGIHQTPTLIKFLDGAVKAFGASEKMAKSYDTIIGDKTISETDMSIFTSPQTLSGHKNTNLATDLFRPLASINNIHISVVASPSYTIAYKWLEMELTLHDRTRLPEIADLIRPEVYVGTSMVIQYGWSHPDNSSNPYADLINSMRVEERYGIKNSSFSFDELGQIKIKLEMSMLGENQIWISRISENEEYRNIETKFEELRQQIYELLRVVNGNNIEPETRAYQIMHAIDQGVNANIDDKELKKEIKKFTSSIKSKNKNGQNYESAQKLAELIEQVTSDDKGGSSIKGLKEQLKRTVSEAMKGKMDAIKNKPDLFLPTSEKLEESKIDKSFFPRYHGLLNATSIKTKKSTRQLYVSLAKVFATYIAEPLRASNKFDEIQIIFYTFNNYCGKAGGSNIGHFPIKIDVLEKVINDYMLKKGTNDMSVGEFGKLLNDAFIADPSSLGYGLGNNYVSRTGIEVPKPKTSTSNIEKAQDSAMKDGPGAGGSWKNPSVEFYFECLSRVDSASDIKLRKDKKSPSSILKIHIYDKAATPWDGFLKLKSGLSLLNSSNISTAKNQDGKSTIQQITDVLNSNEPLKKALGLTGSPAALDSSNNLVLDKINFDVDKIKKIISSYVPTLVYGSNNSGILKANLQSIHDPRLNTINTLRSPSNTSTSPNGSGVSGLPLRVIPGQMEMILIGCPLLSINQQFYIDFGTNTTLDNLYSLTHVSHNISAGKFETSAKFSWADAYGEYENVALKLQSIANKIKSIK